MIFFSALFVEKGDARLTAAGTAPLFWGAWKDPGIELSQKGGDLEAGEASAL